MIEIVKEIIPYMLAVLVGFFFRRMLPSYFNEKGKNLATKEDIEEITKKIESVKGNLQFELGFKSDEKKAIIENFVNITQWINLIANKGLLAKYDNEIADRKLKVYNEYLRVRNSNSVMKLHADDANLNNASESLIKLINEKLFQVEVDFYANRYSINESMNYYQESYFIYTPEEEQEILDESHAKNYNEYANKLEEVHIEIAQKLEHFEKECRVYLKKMSGFSFN